MKEIKGLINKELLEKQMDVNDDDYGGACVKVAINIMHYLDTFEGEFNIGYNPDLTTPHGIICKCDDQGGITGFMAGAAANITAQCHVDGWKFWMVNSINSYGLDSEEAIEKSISKAVKSVSGEKVNLVDAEVAREYIKAVIDRFLAKDE